MIIETVSTASVASYFIVIIDGIFITLALCFIIATVRLNRKMIKQREDHLAVLEETLQSMRDEREALAKIYERMKELKKRHNNGD